MNEVVSTIIKFVTVGGERAASVIQGVNTAAKTGVKQIAMFAGSIGQMGGSLGKAAQQAANFMWSIQQMGAIGGVMAAGQIAISAICDHFKRKADEMLEAVERLHDRVTDRLDRLNAKRMDEVTRSIEKATTKAEEAAAAFDALASSYLKVQAAQNATAASSNSATISGLALEKAKAMGATGDPGKAALVGADYDVRIANERARLTGQEQDAKVREARDQSEVASKKAKMARSREDAALDAALKAEKTYLEDLRTQNDRNVEKSKAAFEAADKAHKDSINRRIRAEADAQAASERLAQAQNERTTALNESSRLIHEAEDAERNLISAQKKAAQAELDRLARENAAKIRESQRSAIAQLSAQASASAGSASAESARASSFASRFDAAFALWRDPAAAQQAQDAAKAKTEDLMRFRKSVDRYGGKWRIDEAAGLMAAGDETGLQDRLAEWRKSRKFDGQTEQMVLAAAAKQSERAAERSLAAIQKSSAEINQKLEAIKAAFEGSVE